MDKEFFVLAAWVIKTLLRKAVENPEKRKAVIELARKLVGSVSELLAELDSQDTVY